MVAEGISEAAPELEGAKEGAKEQARTLLLQGASVEQVTEESGLNRMTVLGLYGAIRKKAKKISRLEGDPSENLGKANQEEENLVNELRDESKLTAAALNLGRNQNRLKVVSPVLFNALHGPGQQPEGNSTSKTLADVELAQYIRALRTQETTGHQNNNGGDSQAMLDLQRQLSDLRTELHKKEIEGLQKTSDKLESQIVELRADLRSSAGSNSDLAVVVKEGRELLSQVISHDGPLRAYLVPSESFLRKPSDAPVLHFQTAATPGAPGEFNFLEEMKKRGLVTKVADVRRGL